MSRITTHILDLALGKPAAGVGVTLERREGDAWRAIASSATDADGRCGDLAADAAEGVYRLCFNAANYWKRNNRCSIYPEIAITFTCGGESHYHLPLLLSDNGYTTYRGS